MNIGLIDSGIGGLSVLRAFIAAGVPANFFYIADSGHLPYGTKSDAYIETRMEILTDFLIHTHQIDALVIACNTATAVSAKSLRALYPNLPLIGIEPAIKPATLLTKTRHIAVAATHSTINSPRLKGLIERFATPHKITVHTIEAGPWVTLVESGEICGKKAQQSIETLLNPYQFTRANHTANTTKIEKTIQIDQFILGCTHFPFLREAIQAYLGDSVNLIDPARSIVKQTLTLLPPAKNDQVSPHYHFYTTGDLPYFKSQLSALSFHIDQADALTR